MAGLKAGADVTRLPEADLRSARFTQEGVQDNSEAIGIANATSLFKGVAEIGGEVYKQDALNTLNKNDQSAIQDYMTIRDAPSHINTLGEQAGAMFKDPNATEGEKSAVATALAERFSSMKSALAQGTVTPAEFSDRILANLREATNKNPGMFKELQAEASRVLELSGITGILKSDELMAKSQQDAKDDAIKDLAKRAQAVNFSYKYEDLSTKYNEINKGVADLEYNQRAFTSLVTQGSAFKELGLKEQEGVFLQNMGPIASGGVSKAYDNAAAIFADTNTQTYAQKMLVFTQYVDKQKLLYEAGTPTSLRARSDVVAAKDSFNKSLDALVASTTNFTSGKDALAAIQNQANIQKYTQESNLRNVFDLEKLEAFTKFATAVPGEFTKTMGMTELGEVFRALLGPTGDSGIILNKLLPTTTSDSRLESIITAASTADKVGYPTLVKGLANINTTISDPRVDPNARATALQKTINSLASMNTKDKPMSVEEAQSVGKTIGLSLKDKDQGLGVMLQLMQQGKNTMDILPDGRAVFSGDSADQFNRKFGNKINTSLKAYANANSMTTKEAAPGFYKEYLSSFYTEGQ